MTTDAMQPDSEDRTPRLSSSPSHRRLLVALAVAALLAVAVVISYAAANSGRDSAANPSPLAASPAISPSPSPTAATPTTYTDSVDGFSFTVPAGYVASTTDFSHYKAPYRNVTVMKSDYLTENGADPNSLSFSLTAFVGQGTALSIPWINSVSVVDTTHPQSDTFAGYPALRFEFEPVVIPDKVNYFLQPKKGGTIYRVSYTRGDFDDAIVKSLVIP